MKKDLSLIPLILANLFPIFGVIYLKWDVSTILFLYWFENIIIGFYNVLKMLRAELPNKKGIITTVNGKEHESKTKFSFVFFFMVHYGMFTLGHGIFIFSLLGAKLNYSYGILLGIVFLFISHGISYYFNFIEKEEYKRVNQEMLFMSPYKRIIPMHITIVFGAGFMQSLNGGIFALIMLTIMKTIVDLFSHNYEHNKTIPDLGNTANQNSKNAYPQRNISTMNISPKFVKWLLPNYEKVVEQAYWESVRSGKWDQIKTTMDPSQVEYIENYWSQNSTAKPLGNNTVNRSDNNNKSCIYLLFAFVFIPMIVIHFALSINSYITGNDSIESPEDSPHEYYIRKKENGYTFNYSYNREKTQKIKQSNENELISSKTTPVSQIIIEKPTDNKPSVIDNSQKIKSVSFEDCTIYIINNGDIKMKIGELSSLGWDDSCIQNTKYEISPSGKYLIFEDVSGGIDLWIRIYSVDTDQIYTLGVWGTSSLLDMKFLENDNLAILNGYPDIPDEQWLVIYDTNRIFTNLDEYISENNYIIGEDIKHRINIESTKGDYFNLYYDDEYLYLNGGTENNKIQRLKYPLDSIEFIY